MISNLNQKVGKDYGKKYERVFGVRYICECGHRFKESEAIVHFGNVMNHRCDMDACPKCDSEDITEL